MNRYKQYTHDSKIKYQKGYEIHQQYNRLTGEGRALDNDLYHIKWYHDKMKGHVYFGDPPK